MASDSTVTRSSLPQGRWFAAVKKAETLVRPLSLGLGEACDVETLEGRITLSGPWAGYIALDAQGFPYPIDGTVFDKTYKTLGARATPGANGV